MNQAQVRVAQEVTRLGGHSAHVFDETIDVRRDEVKNEACPYGKPVMAALFEIRALTRRDSR
jgi:hypothetical protein